MTIDGQAILHALDWFETYNGAVSAIGTAVIAAFTVVLVIVTNRQAKLTRQALITTQRAFVFLEDFDTELAFNPGAAPVITGFVVKPRWRNNGTTPTRKMRVTVNWTHWMGPKPEFEYAYGGSPTAMFLAPQATEWSAAIEIPPHVATAALNREHHIFIWGRVDYEDIFDETRPHFTQWCYRVHFTARNGQVQTQFVSEGPYNSSDED